MTVPDCYFCLKAAVDCPEYPVEKGFIPARMDGVIFNVCKKHLDEVNEKQAPQVTSEGRVESFGVIGSDFLPYGHK